MDTVTTPTPAGPHSNAIKGGSPCTPGAHPEWRQIRLTWDHSEPFPPDPNAPPPRPDRVGPSGRMNEPPGLAARLLVALERELAQLLLIGPAAGAELHRVVYPGRARVGEQWTRP